MKGKTTKQRLSLILAYVKMVKQLPTEADAVTTLGQQLKQLIIESQTSFNDTNYKIRKEAQNIIREVSEVLQSWGALP